MKSQLTVIAMVVLATSVAGCGGGGGGGNGGGGNPSPVAGGPPTPDPTPAPTPTPEPPPASMNVSFTAYSKQMFADVESSPAWEVESVTLEFDSDDDPTAYDDLLPQEN